MKVYVAARDLAGVPIGTHQFIIIELKSNPHPSAKLNGQTIYPKLLVKGKMGYVVGAQNHGNLAVEYFEESDYRAAREYYDKSLLRLYKPDFSTQANEVKFEGVSPSVGIRKIFELIDIYATNQTLDLIPYPRAGLGVNSNSWVQTVIELAGGKAPSDMKGFDVSNGKRIPEIYFAPICLPHPRPVVN